ncbi:unnamed protein product [Cladocopium goreaui]|uniref:Uncharacterized protein n=1 Tax=Cladocopium goreaui TaxID=2562237 RepID=A0A9P1CJ78_9DINO|nr:unnamed protein product [Cladocopium goreaui]
MEGHSELLGQSLRLFLRHCNPKKCEHSVRKAGEMLEALRSDFGLAATDTPTAWSTGTDTAGTAGTLLPGQQEGWTLKLLGLQGEAKVLRNLPCQITFGTLHEKIREVTGAKDQGCDVKLMLNGTVLQHSRATVLSDMSRCNGMELTYLMQPIVPHLGRMLAPLQSLPRKSRIDPEALMRAYETSYNQQRRSVQWAVEAARAREERLTQLISQSPEGSMWNLSCLGSRPFAAAAQQAVLREEEEMNMPTQVLPGVYFGHMEPPNLGRLPTSRRISHLQQVEQRKIREDTVEQRDRYQISDEDVLLPPPLDPRLAGIQSTMPLPPRRDSSSIKPRSTAHRKAAVATWDAIKEVSEQKVLSKEEQDRLKEEKVAYDDWRRQVMVCTRLLNTHINRFETDPVKAGPQYVF